MLGAFCLRRKATYSRPCTPDDPSFSLRRFRDGASTDDPTYLAGRERIYEGMRLAGVPER
jgi:hypothetical protein